jgi:uncharacterized protein with von Willebrand factor type A (vWA) domain
VTAEPGPLPVLVGFARALRDAGLNIGSGQVLTYCRAAASLDLADALDLYWAGRACLLSRHEDVDAYDRVFQRYFGGARDGLVMTVHGELPRPSAALILSPEILRLRTERADERDDAPAGTRASTAEVLRRKHFTDCTPEELAELQAMMARLRLVSPMRRTRRTRPSSKGRDHDLRRTIRRSLRTQGELFRHSWRAPRVRPRRVVLILDISGSMAGYSRALLQFSHAAASRTGAQTEVFCFGTRLTRITQHLRQRHPDQALAQAAEDVVDWEGGTRIGDSLGAFVRIWGRRGLARGAVVVICSDGLERGDPAVLATEMTRLSRLAHRIIWVNPLKSDPRYQPLAQGMRAALPFVDVFISGHDLSSLEALAALLPELG